MADLNYIHSFREGNGRTQRLFLEHLAERAGHALEFGVVSQERNIQASIAAHRNDLGPMRRMLEEIGDPERVETLRAAIRFMEGQDIEWNGRYFAAAAPGFEHSAVLVAHSSQFALLREGEGNALRLVATHPDHLPLAATLGEEVRFSAPVHDQSRGLEL